MSTRQHYLSQCILENFVTQNNRTFLEYNCEKKTSQYRNIGKLFAGYRYWDSWFEDDLANEYENKLAPILKKYCEIEITHPPVLVSGNQITIYPISGFQINSIEEKNIISKLISQQILVQLSNRSKRSGVPDEATISLFTKGLSNFMYPAVFSTHPLVVKDPLIITDGMPFLFMAPDQDKSKLGHVCFMFPISETRFFIWGNEGDCDFFTKKFCNITYLNLCRIEQQGKKCRIASQNIDYINKLITMIDVFSSGEQIKITSIRDSDELVSNAELQSIKD